MAGGTLFGCKCSLIGLHLFIDIIEIQIELSSYWIGQHNGSQYLLVMWWKYFHTYRTLVILL
jgi:hypothetical protein